LDVSPKIGKSNMIIIIWEIMDQKHSFVLDMYIIKPSNQKNYKVIV